MSCFSVIARANAPWKTSPAPSVSTVCTGKAGVCCKFCCSSSQIVPCAPRVPARPEGVSLAIFFSASPSSVTSAASCNGSLEEIRSHGAGDGGCRGNTARRRFGAKSSAEGGAPALGQDGIAVFQQQIVVGQVNITQFRVAEGDDGALAARVDHDVGYRRHQPRHVHEVFGLDAF